jgi:hypothetical protein
MPEPGSDLTQLLRQHVPNADAFLERAERELATPAAVGFRALFASVPRRLGAAAGSAPPASDGHRYWTLTDHVRLWLVLRALPQVPASEQAAFVLGLFESGEKGEQISLLRVLSALPDARRFLETGVQACRHNSRDVFEAIVCENSFLSEHFPDLNFNQAVMKAIFLEVSIRRIEGLERRITPELSRMAASYVSERRAAGRVVPLDAEYLSQHGA